MKVGIYSGTFDPVHKGHVAFALKAAETAGLDKVYFLPEAVPRRKKGVTHYAHRMAMLRLATKPYERLEILDLPDKRFTVKQTLPRLEKLFGDDELHLLIGSDVVQYLPSGWPGVDRLLEKMRLIVGIRGDANQQGIVSTLQDIIPARDFYIVQSDSKHARSEDIRSALSRGKTHSSALQMTEEYIKQNWLYVSIAP